MVFDPGLAALRKHDGPGFVLVVDQAGGNIEFIGSLESADDVTGSAAAITVVDNAPFANLGVQFIQHEKLYRDDGNFFNKGESATLASAAVRPEGGAEAAIDLKAPLGIEVKVVGEFGQFGGKAKLEVELFEKGRFKHVEEFIVVHAGVYPVPPEMASRFHIELGIDRGGEALAARGAPVGVPMEPLLSDSDDTPPPDGGASAEGGGVHRDAAMINGPPPIPLAEHGDGHLVVNIGILASGPNGAFDLLTVLPSSRREQAELGGEPPVSAGGSLRIHVLDGGGEFVGGGGVCICQIAQRIC